jgi:hypothetical protein
VLPNQAFDTLDAEAWEELVQSPVCFDSSEIAGERVCEGDAQGFAALGCELSSDG